MAVWVWVGLTGRKSRRSLVGSGSLGSVSLMFGDGESIVVVTKGTSRLTKMLRRRPRASSALMVAAEKRFDAV